MKRNLIFCLSIFFLVGCASEAKKDKKTDSHEFAIPDGKEMETTELSPEDKAKLAEAKGLSAQMIRATKIEQLIKDKKYKSHLCYFWSLKNSTYTQTLKDLKVLSTELKESQLNILLINLDTPLQKQEINTLVRASGLAANIYILEQGEKHQILDGQWKGQSPAFFIFNTESGTGLLYDRAMNLSELKAVIQPFLM